MIHANQWDRKDYEKYFTFSVKRAHIKSHFSTIYKPIAYNLGKDPSRKVKSTRLPWAINPKIVPTGENF